MHSRDQAFNTRFSVIIEWHGQAWAESREWRCKVLVETKGTRGSRWWSRHTTAGTGSLATQQRLVVLAVL